MRCAGGEDRLVGDSASEDPAIPLFCLNCKNPAVTQSSLFLESASSPPTAYAAQEKSCPIKKLPASLEGIESGRRGHLVKTGNLGSWLRMPPCYFPATQVGLRPGSRIPTPSAGRRPGREGALVLTPPPFRAHRASSAC